MAPLDQFVLFGDSITEGAYDQTLGFALGAQLQHDYRKIFDVINRGYGGYNTRDALKILPLVFPTSKQANIRFLMIFFGANDSVLPAKAGTESQHVPVKEFKENLIKIINHPMVRAHSPRIILVTPPPIEEICIEEFHAKLGINNENPRSSTHTREYAMATIEVERETWGTVVVDLFSVFMLRSGGRVFDDQGALRGSANSGKDEALAKLFTDGLHLSPDGYHILYEEVMARIAITWPEQSPEKLTPPWKSWEDENA